MIQMYFINQGYKILPLLSEIGEYCEILLVKANPYLHLHKIQQYHTGTPEIVFMHFTHVGNRFRVFGVPSRLQMLVTFTLCKL